MLVQVQLCFGPSSVYAAASQVVCVSNQAMARLLQMSWHLSDSIPHRQLLQMVCQACIAFACNVPVGDSTCLP